MNPIKADMLKRKIKTQAEYAKLLGLTSTAIFYLATGQRKIQKQTKMLMKLTTRALQDIQVND